MTCSSVNEQELLKRILELERESERRKKAEEALRESEKRLSQIVQGSSIPTFVIDQRHILTHCNKAFENLTGIRAEEIVGTNKQWLPFYPSKRPVLADLILDGASEEEILRYYGGRCRKSRIVEGGYEAEAFFSDVREKGKWLFFTAAPIKDSDDRIIGAIETLQDITEQKRTEEALRRSERRYKRLLEFLPSPVVLFTLDGRVSYLNSAFTETFGWTLDELEGKRIPYVPPGLEKETSDNIKRLFEEEVILHHESKRITKDGRILDVSIRASTYSETGDEPTGELVILRDITKEKKIARNNEAILRISTALPEYPDLEELLDFVSNEIKRLFNTEGALVALMNEEKQELFFLGVAYDERAVQEKVKDARFSMDQLIAGRVIKTGRPIIINDIKEEFALHQKRDRKLGYQTRNLLLVPLRSFDRIIGALCAVNKKEGDFEQADADLLSMIAGTVALSIENARFAEEIKQAYREVSALNRAKDKVINHLSHELKTPVSILASNLKILEKKLSTLQDNSWKRAMDRSKRNLDRILELQYKAHDILQDKHYKIHDLLSSMLDQGADLFESLLEEHIGDNQVIPLIRQRIDEIFSAGESAPKHILLGDFLRERLAALRPRFSHRTIDILVQIEANPSLFLPQEVLEKVIDGLLKNAIENTPDQGRIEVRILEEQGGVSLVVHDYGVGIPEDARKRIFEGFFSTQATLDYSTKRPFDFNAGGKGTDLLRMKVFSERYGFYIKMNSTRCRYIPRETDKCPGEIRACKFCASIEDCHRSGGTTFTVHFPVP
ncbi:MAG: PAS domain S-box protein [Deltaproteobacteria bacterium]|nr:PAS domain S-box protein [Deltaproteobacteria bacterium]MBW2303118.1 PAS domain S-box protein [Deltaproteobacteria bacterium]